MHKPYWNKQGTLRQSAQSNVVGATKWCLFRPIEADRSIVEDAISERLTRTKSKTIDLLQVRAQRDTILIANQSLHSSIGKIIQTLPT